MRFLILLLTLLPGAATASTGLALAACSGHFLTAAVWSASEDDQENAVFYSLLSLMTAEQSLATAGYEQSRAMTAAVLADYRRRIVRGEYYLPTLGSAVNRCLRQPAP